MSTLRNSLILLLAAALGAPVGVVFGLGLADAYGRLHAPRAEDAPVPRGGTEKTTYSFPGTIWAGNTIVGGYTIDVIDR